MQPTANNDSIVNISLNGSANGQKITINEQVTLGTLGVSTEQAGAPAYPQEQIVQLAVCGGLTPEQRMTQTNEILKAWQNAKAAYARSGGQGLTDRVLNAVVAYLHNRYSLTSSTNNGGWNVKASSLALTQTTIGNVVMFNVQGSPTWG